MMQPNKNEHGAENVPLDWYHLSNLAPRAEKACATNESANGSSSLLSSMVSQMSFEKLSQTFGSTGLRRSNPSSSTSDLQPNAGNRRWSISRSNGRNQEWGTLLNNQSPANAPKEMGQAKSSSPSCINTFDSKHSNDAEMRALLQSLKSKKGPVTVRRQNRFVNEFVQPHDNTDKQKHAEGSVSIGSGMNGLSIRRRPSHSTLRPSKSILLQSRYSTPSLPRMMDNGSEMPVRRKSSSSVKFSSDTVHMFTGEYDKSMWYSKDDQKAMMVDMKMKILWAKRKKREKMLKQLDSSISTSKSSPDTTRSDANRLNDNAFQYSKTNDLSEKISLVESKSKPFVNATKQDQMDNLSDCNMEEDNFQGCKEILNVSTPTNSPSNVGELIVDW